MRVVLTGERYVGRFAYSRKDFRDLPFPSHFYQGAGIIYSESKPGDWYFTFTTVEFSGEKTPPSFEGIFVFDEGREVLPSLKLRVVEGRSPKLADFVLEDLILRVRHSGSDIPFIGMPLLNVNELIREGYCELASKALI